MLVLTIILLMLVFLLVWIIFTPIVIRIDTRKNQYEIELFKLARAWPSLDNDELIIHVKLPLYYFRIDPFEKKEKKTKRKKDKEKSVAKTGSKFPAKRFWSMLRSFRIQAFELSIDTDDYMVNAQLIPLAQLLRSRNLNVSVNFQGNSYGRLEIKNSVWRLGTAYLGINKY